LDETRFDQIYEHVFHRFETTRCEIFNLILDTNVEKYQAKILMLKAYIEFAAIASKNLNAGDN